jgi:hypothetical protein
MFKRFLKNRSLMALAVLLLLCFIGLVIFIVRPKGNDKQVKGVEERNGTTIEYKEGRITKKVFGGLGKEDIYSVGFLPNLTIKDSGNKSWEVTESVLNDKEGIFNANIIFKSDDISIVLSVINNNRTLEAGKVCFAQEDLARISDKWVREKMIDVSGQQTGYVFMKNEAYSNKDSSNFDSLYNEYLTYQKQLNINPRDKSVVTSCSTAARMNLIDFVSNDGKGLRGLARLFYNKGNIQYSVEELKRIDTFVKEINF